MDILNLVHVSECKGDARDSVIRHGYAFAYSYNGDFVEIVSGKIIKGWLTENYFDYFWHHVQKHNNSFKKEEIKEVNDIQDNLYFVEDENDGNNGSLYLGYELEDAIKIWNDVRIGDRDFQTNVEDMDECFRIMCSDEDKYPDNNWD